MDSSAAGISEDPRRAASNRSTWWWTLAGPTAACDSCKAELVPGQRIAYHYAPAKVYCPGCAKSSGVAELCKRSRKLQSKERALERHTAKAQELKEALESRRIKVLEIRKALL